MRQQNLWRYLLGLGTLFHIVVNVALTVILLSVSRLNYPGGVAMHMLHSIESKSLGV